MNRRGATLSLLACVFLLAVGSKASGEQDAPAGKEGWRYAAYPVVGFPRDLVHLALSGTESLVCGVFGLFACGFIAPFTGDVDEALNTGAACGIYLLCIPGVVVDAVDYVVCTSGTMEMKDSGLVLKAFKESPNFSPWCYTHWMDTAFPNYNKWGRVRKINSAENSKDFENIVVDVSGIDVVSRRRTGAILSVGVKNRLGTFSRDLSVSVESCSGKVIGGARSLTGMRSGEKQSYTFEVIELAEDVQTDQITVVVRDSSSSAIIVNKVFELNLGM